MKRIISIGIFIALFGSILAKGYVQPIDNFHQYRVTHERTTLPTTYDSREYGWVLDSRDQLISGTCWAFSCATCWQILAHKNNLKTGYLSPQILVTCHNGFLMDHITGGGNTRVANSMLARLEGIVTETAVPYNHQDATCLSYSKDDVPTYVLGWNYLPEGDATAIKKHIVAYGAVAASVYFTYSSYNSTTGIYEYQGTKTPNHAVTLIGWDDDKQAWLAQNSWGENSFYGGYLWISYQDANIANECTAYTNLTAVNSIDNVHHYTTVGTIGGYGYDKEVASDAIVEYNFTDGEELVAIGAGIVAPNTRVNFTVLDLDAQAFLYSSVAINVPYAGFYKHDLPTPIPVSGNICVAVTYYSETEEYIVPIEASTDNYSEITPHSGNQWVDFNESGNWIPFGTEQHPYNLCVYAYTKVKTTHLSEQTSTPTRLFTGNQIAHHAWDSVKSIRICGIDGKLYKTMTCNDASLPSLVTGVYLLLIEKQDGNTYTEKIWIQ